MKTIEDKQVKDWERLVRICSSLRIATTQAQKHILTNKLYGGVKNYYFAYKEKFVINKRPGERR